MIITSSRPDAPTAPPRQRSDVLRVASIDVEWTKNYRIKNGNRPFCYSIVWLDLPTTGKPADLAQQPWAYTSVYVEDPAETPELVRSASETLRAAAQSADLLTGHQVCSDLAVLEATADHPHPPLAEARTRWKQRRAQTPDGPGPRWCDTRYDAGHLLTGTSRRLVDVCTELGLDVTQPELRGTSMTALHRRWLETSDPLARERISVLNLRHSLSTAYVAARAQGLAHWSSSGLNVNRALATGADSAWPYLNTPAFTGLLEEP
ncbi:hypothetical protein ACWGJ2_19880 [Streptomyces sp. NPDC054796]